MNCKCNSPPSSQRDKKSVIFDQCWFSAKINFFWFRYGRYQNNNLLWLLNRANVKFGSTCLKFLEKSTIDFLTGAVFVPALTVLRVSRLCYYGEFSYTFTENLTSNFNQCGDLLLLSSLLIKQLFRWNDCMQLWCDARFSPVTFN